MIQVAQRKETTVWHSDGWRVAVADRTNHPGEKKALAFFKDIKVASYDNAGLHDHQDGIAIRRIPIHDEIQNELKIAWENYQAAGRTVRLPAV
ncbi:hypothetical protein IKF76_00405 [Candidatus Saccharibacteria bacterium]|nr:hypothetical protein [Candidatus Saccharibacteria bacterium]